MSDSRHSANRKEYGIRKPSDFDGDRGRLQKFILTCKAYLKANNHVYDTEDSQIAFILSFMEEGEAGRWKENYLLEILNAEEEIVFPSMKKFMERLAKDFKPANRTRDAMHQISILRQGKKTAEEVITEFRILTNQAGFTNNTTSDHAHLIAKLQMVLNTNLVRRVMLSDNEPTTIDEWADKAIQIDSQYRHTLETLEILNEEKKNTKFTPSSKFSNNAKTTNNNWRKRKDEKDPNAMDVDAMTPGKRAYLMKKGACFICEEPGHRASEHDEHVKKQQKGKGKDNSQPKKDLRAIHALVAGLTKTEKEELLAMTTGKTDEKKDEEEIDEEDF
jgi:hypothetical protein